MVKAVLLIVFVTVISTACINDLSGIEASTGSRLPGIDRQQSATNFSSYRLSVKQWLTRRSMAHRDREKIALNLSFERKANPAVPFRGRLNAR